jgi:hypothetical protein
MFTRYVQVSRAIAGLLPLRVRREQRYICGSQGTALIADCRYGMPDARDLLALALCADAAIRGSELVRIVAPVSSASLMRIAGLRLQVRDGDHELNLSLATQWAEETVTLSPAWRAWLCRAHMAVPMDWSALARLPPGAAALAVALATEEASVAMADIAALCGTQVTAKFRMHQQIKRWLKMMKQAGLDVWAIDPVRSVLFRTAQPDQGHRLERTPVSVSVANAIQP